MAALQVQQQDPALTSGVNNQVEGDKGTSKSQQTGDSSQSIDAMLTDVLRKYEKAKAAIAEALIQNSNESTRNSSLQGTELDKVLQNNPLWQSTVGASNATTTQGKDYQAGDIQNFFFLIFKFLKEHRDSDSKLQVAQAVNMVAQEHMLDDVTKESTMSLDDMKTKIKKAEEEANSPLAKFLKIGLPILLAVVTIVITVFTMGTAAPAAVAMDAAVTAGAEAGIEAGVEAGVEEGVEAGITEAATQGAEEGATEGATQGVSETTGQITTNVGKQLTSEVMKDTIKTATKEALSQVAKGASKEAVQEAVKNAVQQAVKEVVTDAVKAATQDAVSQLSETSCEELTSAAVQNSIKEAVTETVTESLSQATTKTALQSALSFVTNGAGRGVAVAGGLAAIDAPVLQMAAAKPDNDKAQAINEATVIEQGEMAIDSAASDSIQNTLKQAMSYQQNAQSNQQSDNSLFQQILQTMTKIMYIGNF